MNTQLPAAETPEAALKNFVKGFVNAVGTPEPEPTPEKKEDNVSETRQPSDRNDAVEPSAAVPEKVGEIKPTEGKAPAKEAAKAEKPTTDSEDKWPRSAQEWKKFREIRKQREDELTTKLTAAETKLKELEEKANTPAAPDMSGEVDKWRKEAETYSERLRLLDVTQHPKFQAYFENKTKQQVELAKRIVGKDKGEELATLLMMPDSSWKQTQIEEQLLDLTPLQQSRMGAVMNALADIDAERSREIENARTNHEAIIKEQEVGKARARQEYEKMFSDTIAARIKDNPAFQKRDGDDAYNKAVEQRIAAAKGLLFPNGDVKPEAYINAVLDAVSLQPVLQQALALQKQVSTLEEQIAQLKAATPSIQSGQTPSGAAQAKQVARDPQEAIRLFTQRFAQDMNG